MSEDCSSDNTCKFHKAVEVTMADHEKRIDKLDVILDKVRNRPPTYMTFVFAIATAIIGWLLKLAQGS